MRFTRTIGISLLVIIILVVIYWNIGLPWKYFEQKSAIEDALSEKYNKSFKWDNLSFDFFANKTYHGYLKDEEDTVFYASFANGQFEDSYTSAFWKKQANKDVEPILNKYFPNADFKTSELQENYPNSNASLPDYKEVLHIQVIITDTDYILEDLPAETEKLWDTITELRKSNIPVEKIWLNYENYTAEIKLNTIQSKDDLKEYLEK